MPLTTKDALLERMVDATENLATNVPAAMAEYLPLAGGTMTGDIKMANGNSVASAPDMSVFADYENFTAPSVYSSRITKLAGGYKKVGNIVYVFYVAKFATSMNAGAWTVATNFPAPFTKNLSVLDRVPLTCSGWIGDSESGRVVSANISKDGQMGLVLSGSVSVTSDNVHGFMVYGFYYAG